MSVNFNGQVIAECTANDPNKPIIKFDLISGWDNTDDINEPYIGFMLSEDLIPDSYDYNGDYVFYIKLQDILLSGLFYHLDFDGGERTFRISNLLRRFADLFDADVERFHRKEKT